MAITNNSLFALKLLAALGCGLMAGAFFAFSTFIMSALARLQPAQGIAAMQSINITAINPLFIGTLLGTAVVCIFLMILSLFKWQKPGTAYLLIGSLLYLIGAFGVTMVCNVPLNDALAKVDPESTSGASLWVNYLSNWTIWNQVRTVAALVAAAFFSIALC
jgi:uncharacterized membrane protein